MSEVKTGLLDCFVTVTTKASLTEGREFNLADYANVSEFMQSADDYARLELNDPTPSLVLFCAHSDYEYATEDMIREQEIEARLWDYLTLDCFDDVDMTYAYEALNGDDGHDMEQLCQNAKEKCAGSFGSVHEFGVSYLEKLGWLDDQPAVVTKNIDYAAIASNLLESGSYKVCNNWYFRK